MYKLKDGQFITVRRYGNSFYSCVCDKEKGLISYVGFTYVQGLPTSLHEAEGQVKINIDRFNESLKTVADFDIAKEIGYVVNPDGYMNFIRQLKGHQMTLFQMESFKVFLEERGIVESDLYKTVVKCHNYVGKLVEANEKVFTEQIVPHIPKNWPYAMFHESSWTAYESNINLCNFAQGQVTMYADKVGTTMKDIGRFDPQYRKESTEKFNALSSEIMVDIENGVYAFDEPETQISDESNSGNE